MPVKIPDATAFGQRPLAVGTVGYRQPGDTTSFGQAISGLGDTVKAIDKKIDEYDKLRAEDAYNKMLERKIDLTRGETGFIYRRGADAANEKLLETYGGELKRYEEELAGGLQNDRQRQYFSKRATVAQLQFRNDVLGHVAKEHDIYAKETHQSTLAIEHTNAMDGYRDPGRIATAKVRVAASIDEEGRRLGWDAKRVAAEKENEFSKMHVGIIERMLVNDEDELAQDYYKNNKTEFVAEHRAKIEKLIENSTLRGRTQRKADQIWGAYPDDYEKQLDAAEKISNPKDRDEVKRRLKERKSEREQAEAYEEREAKDNVWQEIVKEDLTSIDEINGLNWSRLNGADQKVIKDYLAKKATGEDIETDWAVYNRLFTMTPDELLKEDLNDYRSQLNNTNFQQIHTLWRSYRDAKAAGKGATAIDAATLSQQITASIKQFQIKNDELEGKFRNAVQERVFAESDGLGRKLNQGERQKVIDTMLMEGYLDRKWWWDKKVRAYQVESEEDYRKLYFEVPSAEKQKIIDALKRANRPTTEDEIMRLYNENMQRKLRSGK